MSWTYHLSFKVQSSYSHLLCLQSFRNAFPMKMVPERSQFRDHWVHCLLSGNTKRSYQVKLLMNADAFTDLWHQLQKKLFLWCSLWWTAQKSDTLFRDTDLQKGRFSFVIIYKLKWKAFDFFNGVLHVWITPKKCANKMLRIKMFKDLKATITEPI